MDALLILNGDAGSLNGDRAAVSAEDVRAALATAGIRATLRPAPPRQLTATLRAAVATRPDAILVGGGDGTIATAAGCLADTGIPLGVLPLGTLNHFARDLGLAPDWRAAVEMLGRAEVRAVDVGDVNGRVFINNCSLGAYAAAVRKREQLRRLRGLGKAWAMALATLAVWRRLRRLRVRLETGGAAQSLRSAFVVIANNQYAGHVLDSSLRPRLDAGQLWVYTTRAAGTPAVLRLFWRSLFHSIDAVEGLDQRPVNEAVLTGERGPLALAADGELLEPATTLRYRIRAGALRVLAPRPEPTAP